MARLTQEQWRRVTTLLDQALDLSPVERARFLDDACGDDTDLRAEVDALIAADARTSPLLDEPFAASAVITTAEDDDAAAGMVNRHMGAYRIVRELGHGGMGAVYHAERADGQFEQQVALKVVRGGFASTGLVQRFLHERQILARLEHPNITRLLDGGINEDGLPYFVMEFVEGEPITDHCDRMRLPIGERLRLFRAVCDAVAYAHRSLIVHRDLKPSNVLVTPDGQVKLLDFGIAKLVEEGDASADAGGTRTGLYLLTPEYAAPEQVRGEPITTSTDVYALGAILYELLCGRRAHNLTQRSPAELVRVVGDTTSPFPSEALARTHDAVDAQAPAEIANSRATDPRRLQRTLRGDLDAIVMKALRKEPEQRYASVDALLADLERHETGLPVTARRGTASYRFRKYVRRHSGAIAAVALIVLALAGGLIATVRQERITQRESARAREVTDFLIGLFRGSDPSEARGRSLTALELLDSGVVRLDRELGDEPELQAEMLTVLGSIYRELAAFPRADTLLRRAVALRERMHGADSEHVVESLNQLGGLLLVIGDYEGADSVLRRALSIRERVLGPRDTLVAVSLNNLAIARTNLGDDPEAEQLYRRAIEIDRAAYGPDHLQLAADLSNLGGVLRRQADYDAADTVLTAAVSIRRRLLPDGDPRLADAIAQLAVLRNAQGRAAEAEQLHREALAIRRVAYGDAHPDVAVSLGSLASTLGSLGRLDEAAPLLRDALVIQERVLGPDHSEAIASLNNLAVLHYRTGDLDAAVPELREVLVRWRRALGDQHPRVHTAANNLGVVLTEKRMYHEAEALLLSALDGRRALHGEDHPDVAGSLRNVGVLLHHTGRRAEAEHSLRRALEIGRRHWSGTHPRLAEVLVSYAELLLDTARPQEAEAMLNEALTIRREHFPESAAQLTEVRELLARAASAGPRR